jgi:hypothetical protein
VSPRWFRRSADRARETAVAVDENLSRVDQLLSLNSQAQAVGARLDAHTVELDQLLVRARTIDTSHPEAAAALAEIDASRAALMEVQEDDVRRIRSIRRRAEVVMQEIKDGEATT